MTEIFTAKTVEEAKALAARRFGKSISEIRFEVLDEGKSGFFGIGRSDAKVRATVVSAPAPAPAAKPEPVV
ncbi:MAG TPA: single-stranded DNA-binding protein, partial [Ruminococcus sp.]|nr:single-stranded DNA-binding protein [Ruminococcus sp.]